VEVMHGPTIEILRILVYPMLSIKDNCFVRIYRNFPKGKLKSIAGIEILVKPNRYTLIFARKNSIVNLPPLGHH
jgi:hypothetical protein